MGRITKVDKSIFSLFCPLLFSLRPAPRTHISQTDSLTLVVLPQTGHDSFRLFCHELASGFHQEHQPRTEGIYKYICPGENNTEFNLGKGIFLQSRHTHDMKVLAGYHDI